MTADFWRTAGCSLFDGFPHCGCPRSPRIGPPPTESKSSLPTTLARFRWAFHHAEASIVPLMCGSLRSRTRFWEPGTCQVTSYPRPPRRLGEHSAQQPPDDTTTESASLQWSSTAPPAGGAPLEHWSLGFSFRLSSTSHRTPNDIKLDLRTNFGLLGARSTKYWKRGCKEDAACGR